MQRRIFDRIALLFICTMVVAGILAEVGVNPVFDLVWTLLSGLLFVAMVAYLILGPRLLTMSHRELVNQSRNPAPGREKPVDRLLLGAAVILGIAFLAIRLWRLSA